MVTDATPPQKLVATAARVAQHESWTSQDEPSSMRTVSHNTIQIRQMDPLGGGAGDFTCQVCRHFVWCAPRVAVRFPTM